MPKFNIKGLRIAFLMAVMFMLLINITYARTIAEIFGNSLVAIGNFFELSQYEPYSNAIDFFLFSILFVSLYMVGAKNVFKEVKKPERVIVILLGLVTAFLLVLAGFSITLLLPYVNWLIFLLLFLFLLWLLKGVQEKPWRVLLALALALLPLALLQGYCEINWLLYLIIFVILLFLLKGIKNRFGRVIVALIITALIFFLLQFLCGYFGLPDISGVSEGAVSKGEGLAAGFGSYVGGLWENIKSVSFNYAPGVPDWIRGTPTGPAVQDNRLEVIHPSPQQPEPVGKQLAEIPPAQAQIKESVLGRIFGVSPQQFSTQGDYNQAVISAGQSPRRIGQNTYYIEEEDGNPVLKRQESSLGIDRLNRDSVIDENGYVNILKEKEKTQKDIELPTPQQPSAQPLPTTTPSPQPAPSPTPSPAPTPTPSPQPTPAPAPSPTPTPSPTAAPSAVAPSEITTSPIGDFFDLNPRNYKTQEEYANAENRIKEQKMEQKGGETYYPAEENGQKVLKRRRSLFGFIDLGYPDETITRENYYDKDGTLKRREPLWPDATIDQNAAPKLRQYLRNKEAAKPQSKSGTEDVKVMRAALLDSPWGLVLFIVIGILIFIYKKGKFSKIKSSFGAVKKLKLSFRREGIESIIDRIISKSTEATRKIDDASFKRSKILQSADKARIYLDALTKEGRDPAMLFTQKGRKTLLKEHKEIEDLLHEEFRFIDGLKELKDAELELLRLLRGGRNGR